MIIVFSWTTDAFLAGFKTVTRREWTPRTLHAVANAQLLEAYDRNPRQHGQAIATIKLSEPPRRSRLLPVSDYDAEGFKWLDDYGYSLNGQRPYELWNAFDAQRETEPPLVVVRFRVVALTPYGQQLRQVLIDEGKLVQPFAA